jgi:hypothetical protein
VIFFNFLKKIVGNHKIFVFFPPFSEKVSQVAKIRNKKRTVLLTGQKLEKIQKRAQKKRE